MSHLSNNCLQGVSSMDKLDRLTGNGLLLHHWDTDGICSATLLIEKLGKQIKANRTPVLGNYYLTPDELRQCRGFDFVIIADMALPKDNILTLADHADVLIFDHHLGTEIKEVFHHNPVIKGKNPDLYPSASWIVNAYLQNPVNLFSLLGIVGDHEQKIQNNDTFTKIIQGFCDEQDLTFDQLLQMVYLIDSNYKQGDKQAVEQAPFYLLDHAKPFDILDHKQWNMQLKNLQKEINTLLSQPVEHLQGIIMKTMHTKSNIISTVTRKITWKHDKNTIVINTGYFKDEDQLYVRTVHQDMQPMIQKGKAYGFKCGGKKEVLGAILPKHKTQEFVDEVISYLAQT
jgi:single-stranded DNA-specific DHH superfamily exonuclease